MMKAFARVLIKNGTEDIEIGESGLISIVIRLGLQEFHIAEHDGTLRISSDDSNLIIEPCASNVIRLSAKKYRWR